MEIPKCIIGCSARPNYGLKGGIRTHCGTHRSEGMVNLTQAICVEGECTTRASYSMEGDKATRCKAHRLPGMENWTAHYCEEENCENRAAFGEVGKKPTRCKEHYNEGETKRAKRCCEGLNAAGGCTKQPNYGFGFPTRCGAHRDTGMKNLYAKVCNEDGCNKRVYKSKKSTSTEPALFCGEHQKAQK